MPNGLPALEARVDELETENALFKFLFLAVALELRNLAYQNHSSALIDYETIRAQVDALP